MRSLGKVLADIFWSALIVLGLLIVAFFILRVVGNVGRGTVVASTSSKVANLATPAG